MNSADSTATRRRFVLLAVSDYTYVPYFRIRHSFLYILLFCSCNLLRSLDIHQGSPSCHPWLVLTRHRPIRLRACPLPTIYTFSTLISIITCSFLPLSPTSSSEKHQSTFITQRTQRTPNKLFPMPLGCQASALGLRPCPPAHGLRHVRQGRLLPTSHVR